MKSVKGVVGSPGRRRTSQTTAGGTYDRELLSIDDEVFSQGPRHMKSVFKQMLAVHFGPRMRLHNILEGTPTSNVDSVLSLIYRWVGVMMIIVSTVAFIMQSMPAYYNPEGRFSGDFYALEWVVVAYFTFDFLLRIVSGRSMAQICTGGLVIDFISFAGFYVELLINETGGDPSNQTGFTLVRVLRLARISRLLRLSRSQRGLRMLWGVILKSKDGLFLLVVLCGIATVVFSSILFYIEIVSCSFDPVEEEWLRDDGSRTPFQSIPHTFWFIAMTITTVGYGDEVPASLGGRAWTVIVMLFGVLVLSFPNILIGSNFADVSRQLNREQSRHQLGKMFRRVRMAVRLVRLWREFRVKGRIEYNENIASASMGRSYRVITKSTNFLFRISDFPERPLHDAPQKAALGNLDTIVHCGVSLQSVLQRLLEGFSGSSTVEELSQSYHFFPQGDGVVVTNSAIFELAVRGAATGLINFFVLNRDLETGLMHLSRKGADMLQNFVESNVMPCMRCYAEARDIWMQTARQQASEFLPMDGYRNWQSVQGRTRRRSGIDFVYDIKNPDALMKNNIFKGLEPRKVNMGSKTRCRCRYCNATWGLDAAMRPEHDTCFRPDVEFLEMEITYAQNVLRIFQLEQKLKAVSRDKLGRIAAGGSPQVKDANDTTSDGGLKRSPNESAVFTDEMSEIIEKVKQNS
jgi:hypothetical protein